MEWDRLVFTLAAVLVGFIIPWIIKRSQKLKTKEKVCPRCDSKDVFYTGKKGRRYYKKNKKAELTNFYVLECFKCHTKFEYYGESI